MRTLTVSSGGMTDAAKKRRLEIALPSPVSGARWIPLTGGKCALVDACDYESAARFNWCAAKSSTTFYAMRRMIVDGILTSMYLHRFILEIYDEREVDHKNGNGLDCRRENLRACNSQLNNMNRSKSAGFTSSFKGVSWDKSRNLWRATIKINRRIKYLGRFHSELEAAAAYNKTAYIIFGEFAKLNIL